MIAIDDLTEFLNGSAVESAKRLLGCELVREINGNELVGRIVETEAYDESDEASHSYHGDTPRTHVMFGPAGYLYVYFSYGMHYCMNITVGRNGYGAAVLIRAIEPLKGEDVMIANRLGKSGASVANGPAKTTQALLIDKSFNGHDLSKTPLQLVLKDPLLTSRVVTTPRVGISHARDKLWRFYIRDNKFVSKARAR